MKITDDLLHDILNLTTVGQALRLLLAYSHEEPALLPHTERVKMGIRLPFHYSDYEDGKYTLKDVRGELIFTNGKRVHQRTAIIDEIDQRIALAQKLLLDHLQEEEIAEAR